MFQLHWTNKHIPLVLRGQLNMGRIGWASREPDRVKTDRLGPKLIEEPTGELERKAEAMGNWEVIEGLGS